MEKRALVAVVLSAVVFMLYIYFVSPQQTPQQPQPPAQNEQQPAAESQPQPKAAAPAAQPAAKPAVAKPVATPGREPRTVEVSNGLVTYRFSELGARLTSATLTNFLEFKEEGAPHKQMVAMANPWEKPMGVSLVKTPVQGLESALYELAGPEGRLSAENGPVKVGFSWTSPQGLTVIKTFTVQPGTYLLDVRVELVNNTGRSLDDNLGLSITALHQPKEGGQYAFKGFGAYVGGKLTEEDVSDLAEEPKVINGQVAWGGYENSYFMQALIPAQAVGSFKGSVLSGQKDQEVVQAKYTTPPFSLGPDQSIGFDFLVFTGPKDIDILDEMGHELKASVNMGWFDIVAKPFLYFLKFTYGLVGNFGVAIIILTILVKLLFWPLMTKSYKSMKRMQSLQPQMAKLREKFKDDKQRLNQEMMGLYKTHKVNPMGGCLPMVVQIPVFIALYRLLDYAIELRHAPFFFWIQDLSAPDRLFRFPFSVPFMEPPYGIPVLTLLMGASMFIQQKMTPTPGDPTQAKVMLLMPIIFTFIFINFPAGLVLYWLVQNILSIGQQTYINRKA